MNEGIIYIVPTPVGNLKDITLRAVEVLKSSDVIFCEDTRTSKVLLDKYEIKAKLLSYHKFNEKSRVEEIKKRYLNGETISIISDAGTPGICDPSNVITKENFSNLYCLPGATAFVPALVKSGLSTDRFTFIGFLDAKKSKREEELKKFADIDHTLVFYESPHRVLDTLSSMYNIFGPRKAVIVREISKIYEEKIAFTLGDEIPPLKGEIVILIAGNEELSENIDDTIIDLFNQNLKPQEVFKLLKSLGKDIKRNYIYDLYLKVKDDVDGN